MYKTLWDEWFAKWSQKIGNDVVSSGTSPEILPYFQFINIFYGSFNKAEVKIRENRKKNFAWKWTFIAFQVVVFVIQLFFIRWLWIETTNGNEIQNYIQIEGSIIIAWIIMSIIIVKILDVGKYQETWSRHQHSQFLRNQEMLLFLLEEEPYKGLSDNEMTRMFVKRIMKVEEDNIKKFCENLENKEKGMFDEIKAVATALKQEKD